MGFGDFGRGVGWEIGEITCLWLAMAGNLYYNGDK